MFKYIKSLICDCKPVHEKDVRDALQAGQELGDIVAEHKFREFIIRKAREESEKGNHREAGYLLKIVQALLRKEVE